MTSPIASRSAGWSRRSSSAWARWTCLINNAGVIEVGPAETMSVSDYEEAMATNFWGMLYPTLAVLPGMRSRRAGRIVNITSIGGKLGIPHLVPYSASKFAAVGFSQGLRAEVAADGDQSGHRLPRPDANRKPRNAIFRGQQRRNTPGSASAMRCRGSRSARKVRPGGSWRPAAGATRRCFSAPCPDGRGGERHGAGYHRRSALGLVDRLLPGPASCRAAVGLERESQSWLSPSWLTRLGDRAARQIQSDRYPRTATSGQSTE